MTTEPVNPTEPTPPDSTPAVDSRDERLSAELDGVASPDLGVGAHDDDTRRAALAAARDLLAVAPPPLDQVTRRRLVRHAADAARAIPDARDARRFNRLGVAAAVLALIVAGGVGFTVLGHGSDAGTRASSTGDKSAAALNQHSSQTTDGTLDLHEVSNPSVLRARVEALLPGPSVASTAPAPETGNPADRFASPTTAGETTPNQRVDCLGTLPVPNGASAPTRLADATFKGEPAVIAVSQEGSRTLIFVVAASDCRLLSSQFLRR